MTDTEHIEPPVHREHLVMPGTTRVDNMLRRVFVEIKWSNRLNPHRGPDLSITGVVGPRKDGNCFGSCGQIDPIAIDELAPGWTVEMVAKLNEIWGRWHLNGMRAGSPRQEAHLRQLKAGGAEPWRDSDPRWTPSNVPDHYAWAQIVLAEAGLQPDLEFNHPTKNVPYMYGHAWISEELPAEVLDWLFALPEADVEYPWRNAR